MLDDPADQAPARGAAHPNPAARTSRTPGRLRHRHEASSRWHHPCAARSECSGRDCPGQLANGCCRTRRSAAQSRCGKLTQRPSAVAPVPPDRPSTSRMPCCYPPLPTRISVLTKVSITSPSSWHISDWTAAQNPGPDLTWRSTQRRLGAPEAARFHERPKRTAVGSCLVLADLASRGVALAETTPQPHLATMHLRVHYIQQAQQALVTQVLVIGATGKVGGYAVDSLVRQRLASRPTSRTAPRRKR